LLQTKLASSPAIRRRGNQGSEGDHNSMHGGGGGGGGGDNEMLAAEAADLVRELDGVPLAITQAAAYIRRLAPRMTLQRYMREFRRSDAARVMLLEQSAADPRRNDDVPNAVVTT
jgi:hypothetical protein